MVGTRTTAEGGPGRDREPPASRRPPARSTAMLALQRSAGNAAVARALREPLDPSLRARLEPGLGVDLSRVRVRRDGASTARVDAIAHTVGDEITVDPDRYRPGTVAGDVLMAHEAAHTVQQRDGGRTGDSAVVDHDPAIEADADRAALSVVADRPQTFLTTMRSALSLRRCKGCSREEEEWLTRFQGERDAERLSSLVRALTEDQVTRLSRAPDGDQLHTDVLRWERAWRGRQYAELSTLAAAGQPGFRRAYGARLVEEVLRGGLTIHVGGDDGFRSLIRGTLAELAPTPHGLALLCDLLATGKPVTLAPAAAGAGHSTDPADRTAARLTTQVTDPKDPRIGTPLPRTGQRRGAGSGSAITIDTTTLGNEVTLGGTPAHPAAISMGATEAVGHELIHALHNAMGISLGSGVPRRLTGLADPLTGEPESPEELYTITGQTRFDPVRGVRAEEISFPTDYAVPATVTENDLRADRGLPARASHFGAEATIRIPRGSTASREALLARYVLAGGPVPPAGLAVIRGALLEQGLLTDELLARLPSDAQLPVPHPQQVLLRARFVERRPDLADRMEGLTVR